MSEGELAGAVSRALRAALHSTEGSAEFWRRWRRYGMDDAAFGRCVSAALGNNLGVCGGGRVGRGPSGFAWLASPPRLWVGLAEGWRDRPPTLEGARLVEAARRLLRVGYPEE